MSKKLDWSKPLDVPKRGKERSVEYLGKTNDEDGFEHVCRITNIHRNGTRIPFLRRFDDDGNEKGGCAFLKLKNIPEKVEFYMPVYQYSTGNGHFGGSSYHTKKEAVEACRRAGPGLGVAVLKIECDEGEGLDDDD